MTQSPSPKIVRRGRIFPEIQWSPKEKARYKAEKDARFNRCKAIFEQFSHISLKTIMAGTWR